MLRNHFLGLPDEFAPPEKAAQRIAELNTIAEREAYFLRIPEGWRPMVGKFVELAIAHRICEMRSKAERQDALASVPEMWREEVRWQTVRAWRAMKLREEAAGTADYATRESA